MAERRWDCRCYPGLYHDSADGMYVVADLGVNYVTQSRLSAAADAAALAGATKFNEGAEQVKAALTVAAQNGVEAGQVEVEGGRRKEVTVCLCVCTFIFAKLFTHSTEKWRKARAAAARPTAMHSCPSDKRKASFEFNKPINCLPKTTITMSWI